MTEIHPYNDYSSIPKGTCLLIIGTAPPRRFSKPRQEDWKPPSAEDVDFYYGSKDNQLWESIFSGLYPKALPAGEKLSVDKRRLFLKSQGIWMHDICQEYTRKRKSDLDKDLVVCKSADLRRILEEHANINTLVFTGGLAETLSGKQMEAQALIPPYHFWAGGIRKQGIPRHRPLSIAVDKGKRKIQTFTVSSPSRRSTFSLDKKLEQYRTAICDQIYENEKS
jgi:G:T/U-mismatch repair DNA glycosylase